MADDELSKYAKPDDDLEKYAAKSAIPGAPEGLPPYPKPPEPQPSNLGTIATGPPLMSMQPGLPSPAQVPENAERMQEGAALGSIGAGGLAGGARGALAVGRGLIGAGVGSSILGAGGSHLGGLVGGETGREIGGGIGALGGAVLGGGLAGGIERQPPTKPFTPGKISPLPFGMQRFIPEWMVPKGEIMGPYDVRAAGPEIPKGGLPQTRPYIPPAHEEIPIGSPLYPGPHMKIPDRMTAAQQELLRPRVPETAAAPNENAKAAGVPYGSVIKLPEPNEAVAPINPNYMGSVPRKELVGMGESRTPGAGTQLQQIGNRIIYTPEPETPPRSITRFDLNPGAMEEPATGIAPPPESIGPRITGGSSESAASQEAINRTASEKARGVQYFIVDDRSGQRTPVSSIDANSGMKLGPNKRIVRVGPEGESTFR